MAKRKFTPPPVRAKEPRINYRITAQKVRVVVEGGVEVMDRNAALKIAEAQGLDLVEVSPDQDPPVCKIIDYGKYKYEQTKKKKEASKHQHIIQIKEVKMRPKIADHDYELKRRNARNFLEEGNKVKVTLRFRGREMAHPDLGMKLMQKLSVDLNDVAITEAPARLDGRQIVMVLGPRPGVRKKPTEKKKDLEGSGPEENLAPAPAGAGESGE